MTQAMSNFVDAAFSLCEKNPKNAQDLRNMKQAFKHLKRFSKLFLCAQPHLLWMEGRIAKLKNNRKNAHKKWKQCLELSNRLNMRYQQWLCIEQILELNLDAESTKNSLVQQRATLLAQLFSAPIEIRL